MKNLLQLKAAKLLTLFRVCETMGGKSGDENTS